MAVGHGSWQWGHGYGGMYSVKQMMGVSVQRADDVVLASRRKQAERRLPTCT
ncbi:hypothetical protein BC567DRAFT_234405 [Phyllosticta citribraziliensis]